MADVEEDVWRLREDLGMIRAARASMPGDQIKALSHVDRLARIEDAVLRIGKIAAGHPHMVAAAPRLLEACQFLTDMLGEDYSAEVSERVRLVLDEGLALARAALVLAADTDDPA